MPKSENNQNSMKVWPKGFDEHAKHQSIHAANESTPLQRLLWVEEMLLLLAPYITADLNRDTDKKD